MFRYYIFSFTVALLLPAALQKANAQTLRITELQRRIASGHTDGEQLDASVLLLDEHESLFKDSVRPLAQRTIILARKLDDRIALGYGYVGLVSAFLRLDDAKHADSVLTNVLPEYPATDATLAPINFQLRQTRVNILGGRSDYENAIKELFSIVHEAEKISYTPALARAFNELGVIAYNRNELDKSLEYYEKVLSYGDHYRNAEQAHAYAYINIAIVLAWQEHFDSALHYLSLAKPICERIGNLYYLANAYLTEANTYKWSKRMPEAEAAMLHMVALREKTEGSISFSNEQLGLANFYVYAKDYDKAINIYNEGLAYAAKLRSLGVPTNYEWVLHYYEGLAKCYSAKGMSDKYEEMLLHTIASKDSLYEHNSTQAIADMQTKYEVQKKETTIIAQKLDITRKNVLLYGSLALLAVVGIIAWLVFRNYRRRNQMIHEEEQRMAAAAVHEAAETERRRIASDLHDSLGSYAASIKSNADELKRNPEERQPVLDLLQSNAQQMVSLLNDTIWAMRKSAMKMSDISDRVKVVLQRLRPNYPGVKMKVVEDLDEDPVLVPAHAYHLFMIVQEAINNALKHSGATELTVQVLGGRSWSVSIEDNGKGMNAVQTSVDGGNGLHNMKARAESMNCSIEWEKGTVAGTRVIVRASSF